MIPYELIVASASRPHLLRTTLSTLLANVNQLPERIWLHDDAAFYGRAGGVQRAVHEAMAEVGDRLGFAPPVECLFHDPAIGHGPALAWLLGQVRTEYVLYSQDDFRVVRPLPVEPALAVMHRYWLHQIRFNKRATMDHKETWQGRWYKREVLFDMIQGWDGIHVQDQAVLTVADHWYFQTGLWRVRPIKAVVDWFVAHWHEGQWFHEHCEAKINRAMDGQQPEFSDGLIDLPAAGEDPADTDVRARVQRTFIWGKIGEDRYVLHTGGEREDWARPRAEWESQR